MQSDSHPAAPRPAVFAAETGTPLAALRVRLGLTWAQFGAALGLSGRQALRIAAGEAEAGAEVVERIRELSVGDVGPEEMHATRLAWLRATRSRP